MPRDSADWLGMADDKEPQQGGLLRRLSQRLSTQVHRLTRISNKQHEHQHVLSGSLTMGPWQQVPGLVSTYTRRLSLVVAALMKGSGMDVK